MSAHEFKAKAQIFHWLRAERSSAYGKFDRTENIASIKLNGHYNRATDWGRNLYSYAYRSQLMYQAGNGSSPAARQQLAKHIATTSHLLLDFRIASNQIFDEDSRVWKNLRLGIAAVKRSEPLVDYEYLMDNIDYTQSADQAEKFKLDDHSTWQPWIYNLGVAAVLLQSQIINDGPLPEGGVSSGNNLDRLMPEIRAYRITQPTTR